MPDIVDAATRSRMMAGIRGRDTRPELLIRRGLHARGFRYRLHVATLPGRPDMVFPSRRAVILIHGCFWHGHDCHLFRWPSTRPEFWQRKIGRNRERDQEVRDSLEASGWRILEIWECALKGKVRRHISEVEERAAAWLRDGIANVEIRGMAHGRG